MALIIRTSASAVAHSKAAGLAMLFVTVLSACGVVVLMLMAHATGGMKALVVIALCFSGMGTLLSIMSLMSAVRKARRPVLIIDNDVIIGEKVAFPVADLLEVYIYGHGRTSFATLITPNLQETITFPDGATPAPSQFARLLRQDYPGIKVNWLGSI